MNWSDEKNKAYINCMEDFAYNKIKEHHAIEILLILGFDESKSIKIVDQWTKDVNIIKSQKAKCDTISRWGFKDY